MSPRWDRDRAVGRLAELVGAETPSGDADRLLHAYRLIADWGSESLGRAPEIVTEDGVPHLLWRATGHPEVLLLGHADTVFAAGTVEQRPFRLDGDRAFGPGVFDMKSGIVVALDALERLGGAGVENVAVLITGDEETGSRTSRPLIESVARAASAVLVLEPGLRGSLKVGRKGGSIYHLTFTGRAAHAGLDPERGRNALLEMARWSLDLARLAEPGIGTTVTPTVAHSGTTTNVVPDSARLSVDVRASTVAELDRVHAAVLAMRSAGPRAVDGVQVEIDGGVNRPPLEQGGSRHLVRLCQEQARRLDLAVPSTATVGGGSDGNFTAALGVPTLDGLGPDGDGAHTSDEWVTVSAMEGQARLVAAVLEALVNGPESDVDASERDAPSTVSNQVNNDD